MLTIDRLAKIDSLAMRIIAAMRHGLDWLSDQYEIRLVDAAHRVVATKAAAICKLDDKISALEDARHELLAQGASAKRLLQEKYKAACKALDAQLAEKGDKLDTELAAAAEAVVAAEKDYKAAIMGASEKLRVEIEA